MTKIHKFAAYILIGTLVISGRKAIALAEADTSSGIEILTGEEPVAGITLTLDELYQKSDSAEKEITQYLTSVQEADYEDLAFAKVTDYVNIRSKSSEEGQILGKLYNNSAATIISHKNGWYKIESGSVKGYIKDDFLVTGKDVISLAKSLGSKMATVTTTTLKVREKASLDSAVLTLVPEGDELKVVKEQEGWVKVSLGENESGYVSAEYVKIQTEYEEAVSIEEEQERLNEEAAVAENSTSENNHTSSKKSSASTSSAASFNSDSSTGGSSELGSKIASYAVQFVGNPYVWGGTSLTNGADCSGFTQSVFAHFGISISRTSRTQANGGSRVSLDNLKPGDLVFYTNGGTINHVAIYIGNGNVISASSPSTGIRITRYNYRQPYKAVRYIN